MGRMIRSKRKWICRFCSHEALKWEGICRLCKKADAYTEIIMMPVKPTSGATDVTRKIRRRAIGSERNIATRMTKVDGPDPAYAHIATKTGRIGHINNIRVDAVSKTYVTENKNRTLPLWLIHAWILINQRAVDFNKNVLLHIEPSNAPKDFVVNGQSRKLDTMAIITQGRHEELIKNEKILKDLETHIAATQDKSLENLLFELHKYYDL